MKKILFTSLVFFFVAVPVFAEWYKDYEEGVDLIRKQNWSQAVPRLLAAISQKSEEGNNIKFYGMKFGDYYPHYYLGLAYFNLQNFEGAMKELQISEQQGAIRKKGELSNKLSKMIVLAEAQVLAKTTPQVAKNAPPPQIEQQKTTPPPEQTPPADKVKSAKAEPPPEIEKTPIVPQSSTPSEKPKVSASTTTAEKSKTEQPAVQIPVTPPPLQQQPVVDVSLEMAKAMIRNGAARYFSGDYDTAISLLTSALDIQSANATAQFLLGCSYAAKYLLTGSSNEELLKNASSAFRKSKQIDPGFRPKNRAYFSPLVLQIYNNIS